MGFETGVPKDNYSPPPPDYSEGIKTYNSLVEQVSVELKSKQAELNSVEEKIVEAQARLQLVYQTTRIEPMEAQIENLRAQISALQDEHDQWVIKANEARIQRDNISLDFSQREKSLNDSWADLRSQLTQFSTSQSNLKTSQDRLQADQNQLKTDRDAFTIEMANKLKEVEDLKIAALTTKSQAEDVLAQANEKMALATASAQDAVARQEALSIQIKQAQPLLDQAEAVSKQKAQNEIDAQNNSAAAIRNQEDANQIKVAKIALNNQQQEYASRMQTLQLAEAALKGN